MKGRYLLTGLAMSAVPSAKSLAVLGSVTHTNESRDVQGRCRSISTLIFISLAVMLTTRVYGAGPCDNFRALVPNKTDQDFAKYRHLERTLSQKRVDLWTHDAKLIDDCLKSGSYLGFTDAIWKFAAACYGAEVATSRGFDASALYAELSKHSVKLHAEYESRVNPKPSTANALGIAVASSGTPSSIGASDSLPDVPTARRSAQAGALVPPSGYGLRPAKMYVHEGGGVGWVIASSKEEAIKRMRLHSLDHLEQSLRFSTEYDKKYMELDFGWFAQIQTSVFQKNAAGRWDWAPGPWVWAHGGSSRRDAIDVVIKKYNEQRGSAIAQLLYTGIVADYDISKIPEKYLRMHEGNMLYLKICNLGSGNGSDAYNRVPSISPSHFDGSNCETNQTRQPYLFSLEKASLPVFKVAK